MEGARPRPILEGMTETTSVGATEAPVLPAALRAPFEGRTWRELGYVLLSMPISVAACRRSSSAAERSK